MCVHMNRSLLSEKCSTNVPLLCPIPIFYTHLLHILKSVNQTTIDEAEPLSRTNMSQWGQPWPTSPHWISCRLSIVVHYSQSFELCEADDRVCELKSCEPDTKVLSNSLESAEIQGNSKYWASRTLETQSRFTVCEQVINAVLKHDPTCNHFPLCLRPTLSSTCLNVELKGYQD